MKKFLRNLVAGRFTSLSLLLTIALGIVTTTVMPSARSTVQDEFADDAARLVKAFSLHAGQTVGDIGAGGGELTVALAHDRRMHIMESRQLRFHASCRERASSRFQPRRVSAVSPSW
jgi:cyclopropane fatty-acyl-phospholipid synthase-like methyltransferase